jgi:hypothetical protein
MLKLPIELEKYILSYLWKCNYCTNYIKIVKYNIYNNKSECIKCKETRLLKIKNLYFL